MRTRILVVIPANERPMFFVPQYDVGPPALWLPFYGFDPDSPYLHIRTFPTKKLAEEFFVTDESAVWTLGQHSGYLVRDVTLEVDAEFSVTKPTDTRK